MHVGGGSSEFIVELGMSAINNIKYLDSLKLRILKGDRNTKVLLPFLKMMPFAINKDSLLTDYFNSIKKEELINSDSWELFYKYIDDLDNPQFQYLLNNRKIFVDKYTKPIIDKKISRGFDLYINKFYNDSVKILKLKTIDSCLYVEVLKNNFKCGFCTSNTKEKYYQLIAKTKFSFSEEKDIRPLEFSKISWFIYNNYKTYNDTLSLIKAKDWAYKACLALPNNHEINDTYAHILFELGKYDNAIIYEKNALSLAKEQKSANANFYYDELMKFEQSKK
jgi:hypothetical protein